MQYEPTEAELNGLSGDEMAVDEAQAVYYEQQQEWERQAFTTTSKSRKRG